MNNTLSNPMSKVVALFVAVVMLMATLLISPDKAAAALPDGQYPIGVTILKDVNGQPSTEPSMTNSYIVGPKFLNVRNGKNYVSFTFTQSKQITHFKVNGVDSTVVSQDLAANTRVIEFEVPNLTQTSSAWISINWPEINYVNSYNVWVKYDNLPVGLN
ncbi:NEAT domain-containing protein [Paenibacillus sp. 481]|uniref:NEAT domain-containing protein n=1 Tax=Paenibacillus sp. 481 TaxID=2835869 RepID=UPI001E658F8D|nr:NEAT domain-containing protein [Paenibacillus sp. 481]UHA74488.1 NEAT domain-containing protein [Paenibacillus sp. 481]